MTKKQLYFIKKYIISVEDIHLFTVVVQSFKNIICKKTKTNF